VLITSYAVVTQDWVRTSYRPTKVDGLGKGVRFLGLYFSQQRPRVPADTWKKWKSETGVSVVQCIGSLDVSVDAEQVGQNTETERLNPHSEQNSGSDCP